MNRCVWSIVLTICLILAFQTQKIDMHVRAKRFLIFPRQAPTRHQFIAGIGIPANLDYESLTVGYVLKAEFHLPYNATVFRQNPFLPEYNHNKFINAGKERKMYQKPTQLRWNIYAFIEYLLNGYVVIVVCTCTKSGFIIKVTATMGMSVFYKPSVMPTELDFPRTSVLELS
ncbi:GL11043 [Drosophila persimilis]|uniref:GL11043 n=1 Tax=Drosophila persimilis TaxID=7234 RepID=B4GBI6_DROPE|nr:GL11043 [Drosophila persimilis]